MPKTANSLARMRSWQAAWMRSITAVACLASSSSAACDRRGPLILTTTFERGELTAAKLVALLLLLL